MSYQYIRYKEIKKQPKVKILPAVILYGRQLEVEQHLTAVGNGILRLVKLVA